MSTDSTLIQNLIAETEQLSKIMERENALLATTRPAQLKDLQEEKGRLTQIYVRDMETLRRNQDLVIHAPPALRDHLKSATAHFQKTLASHIRILEVGKSVTEGIVKAISDEVTRKNRPTLSYANNGQLQRNGENVPTSLSLNQVL